MKVAVGDTHGAGFIVLVLLRCEIMGENAATDPIGALEDVDAVAFTLQEQCSVESGDAPTDDTDVKGCRLG